MAAFAFSLDQCNRLNIFCVQIFMAKTRPVELGEYTAVKCTIQGNSVFFGGNC